MHGFWQAGQRYDDIIVCRCELILIILGCIISNLRIWDLYFFDHDSSDILRRTWAISIFMVRIDHIWLSVLDPEPLDYDLSFIGYCKIIISLFFDKSNGGLGLGTMVPLKFHIWLS